MRKLIIALLFATTLSAAAPPETVIITYTLKNGADPAKLENVLQNHWETLNRLDLVADHTRLAWRGNNAFYEVITWKSADIPDNAPADVLAWWKQMNGLASIKIDEVTSCVR